MKYLIKILVLSFISLINFFSISHSFADNHNIYEIINQLQQDIKTLEKAVYSETTELNSGSINGNNINLSDNSEDVLTRHLLKLTEIENQFQKLTNKFEEINFKLDKLSNRMSKVQADNQIKKITKKTNDNQSEVLPGGSQPQDLGSISYKDSNTNDTSQQTQSIDTTASIVTETFQAEEKILPNESPEKQYQFAN